MSYSKLFTLFFLFFSFTSFASSTFLNKCNKKQSEALLLFKQDLSFINYTDYVDDLRFEECRDWLGSDHRPIMMNWNTSTDCCNWDGVTCDHTTGDVIGIDLSCGMLQGTIHPNTSLFNLPHLQKLSLAYNNFHRSEIPSEIGKFSNSLTVLNLSGCWLSGQVPLDITLLHKLVYLDLSSNPGLKLRPDSFINLIHNFSNLEGLALNYVNISSGLPHRLNISSSLKYLYLSNTGLKGKLPHYIFNLRSLEKLDLFSNTLTGDIPLDISLNQTHLTYLDLSLNKLNGTLPSWLFTSPSLEYLGLSHNMFSGNLPFESFALPSLKALDLSHNHLVGHIDVQAFRRLTNLTDVYLSFNNFSGEWELDTLLSSLKNLEYLHLSHSGFSVTTKNAYHYVNPSFREIHLASCKLKVFPNSFRAMRKLERLDLSRNEIHGQLPHWAGEIGGNELRHLNLSHNFITGLPQFQGNGLEELYLQSNLIQGPFPPSICNISSLGFLDMSNNRIVGAIPTNISSSLYALNVKLNNIEGSFPPSICNMSLLASLEISDNKFGGVIPECIGSMKGLTVIDLGDNNFHGTIQNVFNASTSLEGLILNGNQLEGEVPHSLSKYQFLRVLDLGNNRLSGTFPIWLGCLSLLEALVLRSNNFHGPIATSTPIELAFSSLQVLDISNNKFSGKLPGIVFQNLKAMQNMVSDSTQPEYLSVRGYYYYSLTVVVKGVQLTFPKIFVHYTIIDLSNNKFEGEIPNTFGSLNSLKVLNLSHNNLNGEIPMALGNISGIESLDLSWNQLNGEIPQSLAEIKGLAVLDLSENQLVGRIPKGTQFNTFDESSFEGNPGLCGFPLTKMCSEHTHDKPQLESHEEESGFTWEVVMLGYGCGTLVGLVMGYLMWSTRKVKWFNAIADATESLVLQKMKKKRRYVYIGK